MKWDEAINEIMNYCHKDIKENGKWEDGDELTFLCKDAVVIVSLNDKKLKIDVKAGIPIDMTHLELDLIEK